MIILYSTPTLIGDGNIDNVDEEAIYMHSSVLLMKVLLEWYLYIQPQFVSMTLSRFQLHHMLLAGIAGTEMT